MKSNIYRLNESNSLPLLQGNGKKGLLIVIQKSDMDNNLDTLKGMVQAIKLDFDNDVTFAICSEMPINLNQTIADKKLSTVILLGVTSQQIGFRINAQKYFYYNMEKYSILLADSLQTMNDDKSVKIAFWKKLQERFL